ncbi:MAG: NAD(P)H-dependent oxidoreductase subunit E [Dehalococcoidia bacterium]|nr:NAD(P)H-dependent oxidoreductase subunit E [Dehalococcoidia bacterium]
MVAEQTSKIKAILETQRGRTITALSSLIAIQNAVGYLPPESMEEVASFTGVSVNDVWGVATFYTHFRHEPPLKHSVEVCWGPSCHLRGGDKVMENFKKLLGVVGEKSANNEVSFKGSSCLAACQQAPVIMANEELVGNVKPEQVQDIVNNLDKYGRHH